MDDGVDWQNFLDIGKKRFLDIDIKRVILQTEGVLRISSYEYTGHRGTGAVTIAVTVGTIFGLVTVTEGYERRIRRKQD